MKKTLKTIFSDPIFKQGGILFASSVLVNIFNLIFWLYMVRKLTPEDYGILNSLVSVLMFFSVPVSILQTVITRYTSKFMAHRKETEVKFLLLYFVRIVAIFLTVVLVILILFAHRVSAFLKIDEKNLVYLVALGITLSSFTPIIIGALAGLQRFNDVALNSVASGIAKLAAGFSLVAMGFKVLGALIGFVFSFAVSLVYSFFQLPHRLKKMTWKLETVFLDVKEIYSYFLPAGLSLLCFFALTNMDIILVKHFFSPLEAGYYSVAQMVGKIVLFVPGAIGVVMFPKIVDSHVRNGNTFLILKKCLIVVGLLCGLATFCTFLLPSLILKILTGHSQPEAIELVKFFSLSMSFFALVNILMLYHLSLHRMKYIYTLTLVTLLQFLGIWLFHSSLKEVISILLMGSVALFFMGMRFSLKGEYIRERP